MGTYPKLDALLQDIVNKYETNELTESQAAALAPEHFRNQVLVTIYLRSRSPTAADLAAMPARTQAVQTWFDTNSIDPHWTDPWEIEAHSYGYVPVSLLGALSQLTEVNHVITEKAPDGAEVAGGAQGDSDTATLPQWLPGYKESTEPLERKYQGLHFLVEAWEAGTYDQLDKSKHCALEDDNHVHAHVIVYDTPEVQTRLRTWLSDNNVRSFNNAEVFSETWGPTVLVYGLPVSKIRELAGLEGVRRILGSPCTETSSIPQTFGDDTEGESVHNVAAWHSAGITGAGVQVGVIDTGFDGIRGRITVH